MFYVEVQLDPTGLLCDVKVAHHGENPVVRITEKDKKNTFVFGTAVLLPFCLSQEKDYIEHSPKPNVVPLLLVLVEDQSSHGVICSCGFKVYLCKDHFTHSLSFSLSSITPGKTI